MPTPQASSKRPASLPAQKLMAKDAALTGQLLSPQEVERICKAFIRLLQAPIKEGDTCAQQCFQKATTQFSAYAKDISG